MKINVKNIDKVKEAVYKAEGKAKKRLFPVDELPTAIRDAENKLKSLGIPKKYWKGCMLIYEPPKVANSYDYRAEGTRAVFEYFPSGWFMTSVRRTIVGKAPYGSSGNWDLVLSKEAHEQLPKVYTL